RARVRGLSDRRHASSSSRCRRSFLSGDDSTFSFCTFAKVIGSRPDICEREGAPMQEPGTATVPAIAMVKVRDGTEIAVAVYSPKGRGPFPALFAPSPYRFDNNELPASPQFLWRETGPIDFYVEQGYAYVHMDVRGSGRSGGEFNFFGVLDQRDLYDVIEWIGPQPWSNGHVRRLRPPH